MQPFMIRLNLALCQILSPFLLTLLTGKDKVGEGLVGDGGPTVAVWVGVIVPGRMIVAVGVGDEVSA